MQSDAADQAWILFFYLAENTNLLTKKGKNKKNTTNVLRKNNEKSMKKMYFEKNLKMLLLSITNTSLSLMRKQTSCSAF